MAEVFTSVTAPGEEFATKEEFLAHYRSEYHRYNLRRKVAGLPMASREEFEAKARARPAAAIVDKKAAHVKASKRDTLHRKKQLKGAFRAHGDGAAVSDPVASFRRKVVVDDDDDDDDAVAAAGGEEEAKEEEEEEDVVKAEARATDSFFDARRFDDVSSALEYMRSRYGFFLPEPAYVTDLEQYASYLCAKVKEHRVCLFCNRQFRSFHACQQHMVDKGHCKVAYDSDDNVEELAAFYDFSASYDDYDDLDDEALDLHDDDDDDDDCWEDVDDDDDEDDDDAEEEEDAGAEEEKKDIRKKKDVPRVSVLETGELLVRRGGREKIVGVRWLARYYKQNLRLDDERPATRAVRGEQTQRLLASYKDAGLVVKGDPGNTFFARGLALQVNKRALGRAVTRDQRALTRNTQMNMGMHSGRAKRNKANMLIKNKVAGKNRGEGVGVHG